MDGSHLPDTNVVVALFNGDPDALAGLAGASDVIFCSIVIGELSYGAFRSGRRSENVRRVEHFASRNRVLSVDTQTGHEYGKLKQELRVIGRPISENDIWIAAIARQHGLIVATPDSDFSVVPGLRIVRW